MISPLSLFTLSWSSVESFDKAGDVDAEP